MVNKTFPPDDDAPPLPGVEHKLVAFKTNGKGMRRTRFDWELAHIPKPEWFVRNRFAKTGVGALIGRGYTGKTQTLVDLASCATTGRDWAGERIIRKGGVVYFTAEGGPGLTRSWQAVKELATKPWYAHQGTEMPSEFPFALCTEMPTLLPRRDETIAWFSSCIAEAQAVFQDRFGVDVVLVVFETLAKIAGFRDENSNAEVTDAFKMLDLISTSSNAFVLTSDHLPKDEQAKLPRGGSAKFDNADTILRIALGEADFKTLHVDKLRDGDGGVEVPFKLTKIERGVDEEGDAITSVRVTWLEQRSEQRKGGRSSMLRPRLMQAMDQCFDDGYGKRITIPSRGNYFAIPEAKADYCYSIRSGGAGETEESIKRGYRKALDQLKKSGQVDSHRFDNGEVWLWYVKPDQTGS